MEPLMTPKQVCESGIIPGMTIGNLARLRYEGTGAKFVKLGRSVYYRRSDIADWIEGNVQSHTTPA